MEFDYRKKHINNFLYSKWTILLLLAIIGFAAEATWGVYQKEKTSKANLERTEKELDRLIQREKKLKAEVARLQTDRGIEREIRSKFGVAKEGEQVVIIVEEEQEVHAEQNQERETIWGKILEIFDNLRN